MAPPIRCVMRPHSLRDSATRALPPKISASIARPGIPRPSLKVHPIHPESLGFSETLARNLRDLREICTPPINIGHTPALSARHGLLLAPREISPRIRAQSGSSSISGDIRAFFARPGTSARAPRYRRSLFGYSGTCRARRATSPRFSRAMRFPAQIPSLSRRFPHYLDPIAPHPGYAGKYEPRNATHTTARAPNISEPLDFCARAQDITRVSRGRTFI